MEAELRGYAKPLTHLGRHDIVRVCLAPSGLRGFRFAIRMPKTSNPRCLPVSSKPLAGPGHFITNPESHRDLNDRKSSLRPPNPRSKLTSCSTSIYSLSSFSYSAPVLQQLQIPSKEYAPTAFPELTAPYRATSTMPSSSSP